MKRLLIFALLLTPLVSAYNNPFDNGWSRQLERPKIELCYCTSENNVTITGHYEAITWINPNRDGNKMWGINSTSEGLDCELPDYVGDYNCPITSRNGL